MLITIQDSVSESFDFRTISAVQVAGGCGLCHRALLRQDPISRQFARLVGIETVLNQGRFLVGRGVADRYPLRG